MKKLLALIFLISLSSQGADTDLRKGIDLTGMSSFPGTALNQLVDNGTIATNKALGIISPTAPDASGNPRYTNWFWMDVSSDPPVMKTYSKNLANWFGIGVGPNSVGTAQLIDGSVTTAKIAVGAVDSTRLANNAVGTANLQIGSVSSTNIQGGGVTGFNIQTNSIDTTKLGASSVDRTNLAPNAVTSTNIAANSIYSTNIVAGQVFGTNIALNTITSTNIGSGALYGTNMVNNTIGTNQVIALTAMNTTNNYGIVVYTLVSLTNAAPALTTNSSSTITFTHQFGVMPLGYRVVYVCVSAAGDNGYAQGDEIDALSADGTNAGGSTTQRAQTIYANSTSVFVVTSSASSAFVGNKATGVGALLNTTKWVYKCYAWTVK